LTDFNNPFRNEAMTSSRLPIEQSTITAPDGTLLAVLKLGNGPPLVICHGAFTMAQDWLPFAAEVATTRTVYLYDRRGRGKSIPYADSFAKDAEVDDLAAMVALAGPGTAILGHSFGGACALAFAAREKFDGTLIVYEPPHSVLGPVSCGHIPEIERLIATGDMDAATQFAIGKVVGMPPEAIAAFRETPLWESMCQTVTAFPNELRLLDSLTWQEGDLSGIIRAPTLLIGAESPVLPDAISPVAALQKLLPSMRAVSIPGQGHVAYLMDPALLAGIVIGCLTET
jgi:pimeloyl-ACP methyl ester carboxylesterase